MNREVVVVSGVRTAIGDYGSALREECRPANRNRGTPEFQLQQ